MDVLTVGGILGSVIFGAGMTAGGIGVSEVYNAIKNKIVDYVDNRESEGQDIDYLYQQLNKDDKFKLKNIK